MSYCTFILIILMKMHWNKKYTRLIKALELRQVSPRAPGRTKMRYNTGLLLVDEYVDLYGENDGTTDS